MALREFQDPQGAFWRVWDTRPARDASADGTGYVQRGFEGGWLVFEAGRDKRRLAPIPADWEGCADGALWAYCEAAMPARAATLKNRSPGG